MNYHFVALFDEDSNDYIQVLQKKVCKKYKLYRLNSQFHIPLLTLVDPDIDKFNTVISDLLTPYKKFKVKLNNKMYLDKNTKTVNFKIENKGYINRISRNSNTTLNLYGFNLKNPVDEDLHISLANSNYSLRKMLNRNNSNIPIFNNHMYIKQFAKISKLELWRPLSNKKSLLIKSFPLREF